jgi:hypothetical protein
MRISHANPRLQDRTQTMQQRCFFGIVQIGVIFDLIDRAHAQIGAGNSLLKPGWQTDDWNKKSPAVFFQDAGQVDM